MGLVESSGNANPNRRWNEFIDKISGPDAASDPIRRSAHFVFLYESEVQNGGHLQYFENAEMGQFEVTTASLKLLGATCQEKIHSEGVGFFLSRTRTSPTTVEEYLALALEGEFDDYDKRFHACSWSLIEILEGYLGTHQHSFFPAG